MNVFRKFVAYLQLREAVSRADKAHEKNGERYYVMPQQTGGKPKLIIMDRRNFRILRSKHYISRNSNVNDLIAECFYFTPYSNGSGYITEDFRKRKVQQFFAWMDAQRKLNKKKGAKNAKIRK